MMGTIRSREENGTTVQVVRPCLTRVERARRMGLEDFMCTQYFRVEPANIKQPGAARSREMDCSPT